MTITSTQVINTIDKLEKIDTSEELKMHILGITLEAKTVLLTFAPILANIIIAILIFIIGKWIAKKFIRLFAKGLQKAQIDATLVSFITNVLYAFALLVLVLTALNQVGISTTSAAAVFGGAALAIGLSLKDQLSSFAAGVIIILFRPFRVGELVEIGGVTGVVQEIKIIHTTLVTLDNQLIVIPNGNITTHTITNYWALPERRINLTVGIGYSSDLLKAKAEIMRIVQDHEKVLTTPEPSVQVTNLGDNAVDITLYAWTKRQDWWATSCEVTEQIKLAFDAVGIDIPFPQRSVHITGLPELVAANKQQPKTDGASTS